MQAGDTEMLLTHFDMTSLTEYKTDSCLDECCAVLCLSKSNLYQSHSFRIGTGALQEKGVFLIRKFRQRKLSDDILEYRFLS